jgi:hypothetical protein
MEEKEDILERYTKRLLQEGGEMEGGGEGGKGRVEG